MLFNLNYFKCKYPHVASAILLSRTSTILPLPPRLFDLGTLTSLHGFTYHPKVYFKAWPLSEAPGPHVHFGVQTMSSRCLNADTSFPLNACSYWLLSSARCLNLKLGSILWHIPYTYLTPCPINCITIICKFHILCHPNSHIHLLPCSHNSWFTLSLLCKFYYYCVWTLLSLYSLDSVHLTSYCSALIFLERTSDITHLPKASMVNPAELSNQEHLS